MRRNAIKEAIYSKVLLPLVSLVKKLKCSNGVLSILVFEVLEQLPFKTY